MTSELRRDPVTDQLLTPENSALLIIDYQPVQVSSVASMDRRGLVLNIVDVAECLRGRGVRFRGQGIGAQEADHDRAMDRSVLDLPHT